MNIFIVKPSRPSRKNILKKTIFDSVLIHAVLIGFLVFTSEKPAPVRYLKVSIVEDSEAVSRAEQQEAKKTVKKTAKKTKKKRRMPAKQMETAPNEARKRSLIFKEKEHSEIKSIEKQRKKEFRGYRLSKKVSHQWKLEKDPLFYEKKGFVETARGVNITESIQWKYNVQRKIVYRPQVEYPYHYRKKGIQGKIRLSIRVDNSGNVIYASIVQSSGYSKLDVIAQETIRATRFSPGSGLPGEYDEAEIDVNFRLKD